MKDKNMKSCDSLPELADKLVKETKNLLREAITEDDLKIRFEKLLEPVRDTLGIRIKSTYGRTNIFGKRPDAAHGGVIIEYEHPRSFSSKRNIKHAYEQLANDYLPAESKNLKPSSLVGVGFDGEKIFFVKYRQNKWIQEPIYEFNPESAKTFLIHLRGLARLSLTAENLAQKFGSESKLAQDAVQAFVKALENWVDQTRTRTFFDEWKRLFGIVYGESFTSHKEEEAKVLSNLYKAGKDTDFQKLLFCVHTYFAFLMKLIAAEILTLRETSFGSSRASQLANISNDELKSQLEDIENGGIYARKGITNFLEGDFFRWYLDALDSPELKDAIREVARALSEFEPATSTLDPISTRDLLKKLYQYLVPQEIRHRLGEYYTPDWLAELLLNEVGYDGNTLKRFLDPACGSGTFLVLAIQRAIKHGREKEGIPDLEIAKRIIANIWGFDLNPLAVIAARTNYLLALGDLANELQNFEIPIYLADSVLWPERRQMELKPKGESIEIHTSVGSFFVPKIWIKENELQEEILGCKRLISKAAPLIENMVKEEYSVAEAMERFKKEGLVFPPHEDIVSSFYTQILELEKQHKNGIWARFLKNVFAPMIAGEKKFDFVVGNPPWIRWDFLAGEYRKATKHLWKDYGLFSLKGYAQMLGGAKPDFSMLFVYASSDYYLKDGAKLGFLITQEVFKAKGAGEGFRRFQLGEGKYLRVLKAHDLVSVQPFEGAANKTAAIILKKGERTKYPVPYFVWNKKGGVGKIATDKLLDEVLPLLQKRKYNAEPISPSVGAWQTYTTEMETLGKIQGKNYYKAVLGANPNPYGVFWLDIKQVLSSGDVIVHNLTELGKLSIPKLEATLESNLIYPSIRGADIKRWGATSKVYILLVNDPNNPMSGYPEKVMKKEWPRVYSYLTNFKNILLQRALYKKFHEKIGNPFYSQYNIGSYTFSRYKVVWKRMATDIVATVISEIKTPFGYKAIIPLDTTVIFSIENESEAHYLCAIINSNPVRDFIKSFSSAGRGFGTPSVMEHVGIPKFDPKNALHQRLSEISKKCHQLKAEGKEKEIEKLEKENDNLVSKLFGISQ